MSEFIEHRFNSVPTGKLTMLLANTALVLVGNTRDARYDHILYTTEEQTHRFLVPNTFLDRLRKDGYTAKTYPDWETCAHWERLEEINIAELSTPEISMKINDDDITLTHFNSKLRFYADNRNATHVEYYMAKRVMGFIPDLATIREMFKAEYPAIYMSSLALDLESAKWLARRKAA